MVRDGWTKYLPFSGNGHSIIVSSFQKLCLSFDNLVVLHKKLGFKTEEFSKVQKFIDFCNTAGSINLTFVFFTFTSGSAFMSKPS